MERRRALLIGIPEYDEKLLPSLPAVQNDVAELERTLLLSGYDVRTLGTGDKNEATLGRLMKAITELFDAATDGDTLFLYFSCHGCRLEDGIDYIIPVDASLNGQNLEKYLLPLEFAGYADASRARTVLVVVDACREGLEVHPRQVTKGPSVRGFGSAKRQQVSQGQMAYWFGCHKGEFCRCVGDEFSVFSRAMTRALAPENPARTLPELKRATDKILEELTHQHKLKHQKTWLRTESSEIIEDTVFCEGATSAGDLPAADPWAIRVGSSTLWSSLGAGAATETSRLLATTIARLCRQHWLAGRQELAGDPWPDEAFAPRVIGRLEVLAGRLPTLGLTAAETCLLMATPFLYQALLAAGMALAAREAQVFDVAPQTDRSPLRVDLEKVHQSFPAWVRQDQRLRELGRLEAANAVAAWMLHLCLRRRPQTFLPEERGGSLPATFLEEIRQEAAKAGPLWADTFASDDLFDLAHCLSADIEFPGRKLEEERQVGADAERGPLRMQLVGTLLLLAADLAVDPAALDGVLVSHLGSSDPLEPAEILETLGKAQWSRRGEARLSLDATCRHPAFDQALRLHVEELGKRGAFLQRAMELEERKALKPLLGLPWLFDADGLKPEKDAEGHPRYTTPHLRFHLAQDEVRELLLGERIYDDPSLAIRELYQNALDACRYRQAREEYLKRTGRAGNLAPWEGSIVFRQWREEDGRGIIECEDNGVGMGRRELETCFARAGRRFADTPEYLEEEAEWHKLDPPLRLYPNSQFGIGVFSYFLLADEIEVFTRRFEKDGKPGKVLHVQLSGSGSLFRIRELKDDGQPCGCRIRLVLAKKEISCLKALRARLWRAEFPTKVCTEGAEELWPPGELKVPSVFPASPRPTQHRDVFWLTDPERFAILADGVLVASGENWSGRGVAAALVDLNGAHRPKLALNRNSLASEQASLAWVTEELENSGEAVGAWPDLNVEWLWKLAEYQQRACAFLARWVFEKKVTLRLATAEGELAMPLARVGFFPQDIEISEDFINIDQLQEIPKAWLWPHLEAWHSSGFSIPEVFAKWLNLKPPGAWRVPDPAISIWFTNKYFWSDSPLSAIDLFVGATWAGLSIGEFASRLPPPLDQEAGALIDRLGSRVLEAVPVPDEDRRILSKDFTGSRPWVSGRVGMGHLLNAAEERRIPLEAVLERLRTWEGRLALELPSQDITIPEGLDRKLLRYFWLSGVEQPWRQAGPVRMTKLWDMASGLQLDFSEVVDRLQVWAESFALELPPAEKIEKFARPPEGEDVAALKSEYGRWIEPEDLTPMFVWKQSTRLRKKPSVVLGTIRRWVGAFDLPMLEMPEDLPEPDGRSRRLLCQSLSDNSAGLKRGPLHPLHVLCAAVEFNEPVSKVLRRLEPYKEAFGLEIPAELYELP